MRFEDLLSLAGQLPVIESSALIALGADRKSLNVALSRWVRAGKLVQLRRGIYLLPARFRRESISLEWLANLLVRPSYISKERALAIHGIIPERVPLVQSITTRRPEVLSTELGEFAYQHVMHKWFFGFKEIEVAAGRALVATPEKALLDLLYLSTGEYDERRILELRLQNLESINLELLTEHAERANSKRMMRVTRALCDFISSEESEMVAL